MLTAATALLLLILYDFWAEEIDAKEPLPPHNTVFTVSDEEIDAIFDMPGQTSA